MSRPSIGIVDYGFGNVASVSQSLSHLGYRCRIAASQEILEKTDLLVLPGVGAFPAAMAVLQTNGLADYIGHWARSGRPLVGICLGMQLLAESSNEHKTTAGLGLIAGKVVAMTEPARHIGWNDLEIVTDDPMFKQSNGHSMYFNHSYILKTNAADRAAVVRLSDRSEAFTVAVRHDNIVGLQFHPEKSQTAGRALFSSIIEGLCHA